MHDDVGVTQRNFEPRCHLYRCVKLPAISPSNSSHVPYFRKTWWPVIADVKGSSSHDGVTENRRMGEKKKAGYLARDHWQWSGMGLLNGGVVVSLIFEEAKSGWM